MAHWRKCYKKPTKSETVVLFCLKEFLKSSDKISGLTAPAGIVLLVGGPGSGKGVLSERLTKECGIMHSFSGDLLREEVSRDTLLGR